MAKKYNMVQPPCFPVRISLFSTKQAQLLQIIANNNITI